MKSLIIFALLASSSVYAESTKSQSELRALYDKQQHPTSPACYKIATDMGSNRLLVWVANKEKQYLTVAEHTTAYHDSRIKYQLEGCCSSYSSCDTAINSLSERLDDIGAMWSTIRELPR